MKFCEICRVQDLQFITELCPICKSKAHLLFRIETKPENLRIGMFFSLVCKNNDHGFTVFYRTNSNLESNNVSFEGYGYQINTDEKCFEVNTFAKKNTTDISINGQYEIQGASGLLDYCDDFISAIYDFIILQ